MVIHGIRMMTDDHPNDHMMERNRKEFQEEGQSYAEEIQACIVQDCFHSLFIKF